MRTLFLLLSLLLAASPSMAAGMQRPTVTNAMPQTIRSDPGEDYPGAPLAATLVEFGMCDRSSRRNEELAKILRVLLAGSSARLGVVPVAARRSARSGVVQSFRIRGVRLLTFGTAPPPAGSRD